MPLPSSSHSCGDASLLRAQVRDFLEKPLRLEVFDDDKLSKDDSIGAATMSGALLSALVDEALRGDADPDGQEFWVPLPTQGMIQLKIYILIDHLQTPSLGELAMFIFEPVVKPVLGLANMPTNFRLQRAKATVRITIRSAERIPAADGGTLLGGGTSDPYAVISLADQQVRTKTVNKTISPVWEEAFDFTGLVTDFTEAPMELELFDDDLLSADDSIGFTDVTVEQMAALFDYPPDPTGTDLKLTLTTRGTLTINIALIDLVIPTFYEASEIMFGSGGKMSIVSDMWNMPQMAAEVRRKHTLANITVTLHKATNLIAADTTLFGGEGTSDPYVTFELAGETHQSTTIYKTLNPIWSEEAFVFESTIDELESDEDGNLNLEVFDDDDFSADDPIGAATLPITTILNAEGQGPMKYTLNLSTKGQVYITVEVQPLVKPSWPASLARAAKPWLIELRSFILYYRIPYDVTIWTRIRDPWYYVMMYISASPDVFTRGGFFTIYLACIISELEEYQVMRFILGLKGTQFLSGIFKFIKLSVDFWKCTVTSTIEDGCMWHGPGVGHTSVLNMVSVLLWLQFLLWIAFLVLPLPGSSIHSRARSTGDKGLALWAEAMEWAQAKAKVRREPPPISKKKQRAAERKAAKLARRSPSPSRMLEMESEGYRLLKDDDHFAAGAVPPPPTIGSSGIDIESAGVKTKPQEEPPRRRFSFGTLLAESCHTAAMRSPLQSQYLKILPHLQSARKQIETTRVYADALTYPLRAGGQTNRLFSLLTWDTFAFAFCCLLFFIMMLAAEWTRESLESGGEINKHILEHICTRAACDRTVIARSLSLSLC